jgi:G:T-mismatch repair DNA endonuclease (very short patch repair protein)
MNKTKESDIYKLIKKAVVNLKLNCHLTRIESGLTLQGIPDLYIAYHSNLINKPVCFWLEIKSNNLKNCNVSKYQFNWIYKHSKSGGVAYILNRPITQGGLKLYRVDPCSVVTEVLSTEYSITGIANVFEWVAKKHCIA